MHQNIKVILFDLGNVLVELGEEPLPSNLLNETFDLSSWFKSETALLFEKGLISPVTFAETLKQDLKIEASTETIIEHFTQWPIGVFPGTHELLDNIDKRYRLNVLTNTNELHWPRVINEFEISHYFEEIFASHLLHLAKPDIEIFKYVSTTLNVKPEDILFLDDNQQNIESSKQAGFNSHLACGIEQVKQVLSSIGAIQP